MSDAHPPSPHDAAAATTTAAGPRPASAHGSAEGPPDGPSRAIHRARPVARDARHEAFLRQWERRMSLPIVLSAVVPLLLSPTSDTSLAIDVIAVASWLVFLADLVVHLRCLPGYLRTGWGKADLAIVVLTFPLYLITGGSVRFIGLARLARLVRVVVAARGMRRVFVLLNRVVIVAAFVLVTASFLVWQIEGPENGFDTFGDSLWWGIVTITTVGYGDMVPQTAPGRVVAAMLMITGIGVVGALAGTLAQALRLEPVGPDGGEPTDDAVAADAVAADEVEAAAEVASVAAEVAAVATAVRPTVGGAAQGAGTAATAAPTPTGASDQDVHARLARIEAQLDQLTRALLPER